MNRKKSVFVTLVIAAMLAVILVGAHRQDERIYGAMLAVLACYGYVRGAGDLCRWLQGKDNPVPVVEAEVVDETDPFAHDDEYAEGTSTSFGGIRFSDGVFGDAGN